MIDFHGAHDRYRAAVSQMRDNALRNEAASQAQSRFLTSQREHREASSVRDLVDFMARKADA